MSARKARAQTSIRRISEGFPKIEHEAERIELEAADGQPLCMVRKRARKPVASVLCFHGLAQNRYSFDLPDRSLANYLVWRGFEVFLAEFRGHGLSGELGSRYPESFSEKVFLDAPAFVRTARRLAGRRPFVLGHSLGATVAYAMPQELDGEIAGIVGVGGPSHLGLGLGPLRAVARLLAAVYPVSPFRLIPDAHPFHLDWLGTVFWTMRSVFDSP
ncbi:MAG TPA: alpha/beta fold hydrolase, partial [Proteobacteria bacterium]|nr:alpha/beta fold hydrolase [Pseudomonadota bacterium]